MRRSVLGLTFGLLAAGMVAAATPAVAGHLPPGGIDAYDAGYYGMRYRGYDRYIDVDRRAYADELREYPRARYEQDYYDEDGYAPPYASEYDEYDRYEELPERHHRPEYHLDDVPDYADEPLHDEEPGTVRKRDRGFDPRRPHLGDGTDAPLRSHYPARPRSCGEYYYWDGRACVDARRYPPYVGPKP